MRRWLVGLLATSSLGGGTLFAADRAVNPYDDKATHFELPITSDIPQGERVEIAKDKAAMTLKGWNDEYAITITPQIPTATFGADKPIEQPFNVEAHRKLFSKKVEYRSGDVTAFIEPKEETENEFDIDFTLHSKPDTNIFEYKIEGAEDFDFFYQTELTAEEIAEGAERPENVVGSYAVYHKTKANHRIGSTNYATGKAFHIYRPKAIDANGAEVWAELSYLEGVLAVTVPQKWLKTATYPVRVDPNFGYESVGATQAALAPNNIRAFRSYSASETGTATQINFQSGINAIGSGTSCQLRPVVYLNSDLSRVTFGSELSFTTPTDSTEWKSMNVTSASISATAYALGVWQTGAGGAGPCLYRYDGAAITLSRDNTAYHATNDPPATFTENSTVANRQGSIYATYTADAGGGATPQDNTYFEIISALLLFPLAYIEPRRRLI